MRTAVHDAVMPPPRRGAQASAPPAPAPAARGATCDCGLVVRLVRGLSLLTHAATCFAGAWGVLLAIRLWALPKSDLLTSLNNLSGSQLALFTGLLAVYFVLFGLLGVAAELRTQCLRQRLLRHFSALEGPFGRAALSFYLGSLLVLVPWDNSNVAVSIVPGSLHLGVACAQVLVGLFVVSKDVTTSGTVRGAAKRRPQSSNAKAAAAIQWGAPEAATPLPRPSDSDADDGEGGTDTGGGAGLEGAAVGGEAPGDRDSRTVDALVDASQVTTNPFLTAMSANSR